MRLIALFLLFINPGYSHYYRNNSDQAYCRSPLGMANGAIKDEQITAPSAYDNDFSRFGAHRARLNLTREAPGYRADGTQSGGWIKIELEKQMVITAIATQGYGDPNYPEWTELYMVMYSNGGDYLYFQNLEGGLKTFTGNKDSNSIQRNEVPLPTIATSIMLMESGVHRNFAIRIELFGCEPGYYFVVWLMLGGFGFSTTYLDKQEVEYQGIAEDVVDEVKFTLKRKPGFLSASLLQLSPQASGAEIKLKAEFKIECIEASVHDITATLKSYIQLSEGLFDRDYLKLQYPLDYLCRPPHVHIHLNKTHKNAARITAVDLYVIIGEVTAHCNTSSSMLLSWERSVVNEESGVFAVGPPLDKFRGSKNLTIEPRTLPPGLYYIRLIAEMTKEEGAIDSDFGFLEVVLPEIVAKILGVNKAVKGTGKIALDASHSYDPYEINLKDQGLVFTWLCRREEEDFSNIQLLSIDQSYGRDKLLGGCFGYGVGKLNTTEPTIEIDINGMISQNSYVFKVIVQKGNRSSSANHTLLVESSISFSIRCKINCGDRVTANKRMVIESTCTGLSCKTIKSYNWTLFMRDLWSFNETWMEQELGDKILTEIDSPSLVFKGKLNQWENSLMDDATYRLRGIVRLADDTTEESEIFFKTNSAPFLEDYDLGCKVSPKKGHAVTTEFFISCDGWNDDDLPLSYEFSYHTNTGAVVMQKGLSPNATTRLPLGNPLHDYAIALEIQIVDSLGASTLEILVARVEAMPSDDVSGTLMNMASGEESPLSNLLKLGDVDKAATMAYAVLSMVDKSEGKMASDQKKSAIVVRTVLRSQFNVTKNSVRDLKDAIIGQMSNVKVTSLEQVTQMAAVVALATEQKDEISTNSQENAVNLLENTADFVSSQLSSGTADTEVLQKVGASLLHGISNVMSAASTGAKQEKGDKKEGEKSVSKEETAEETDKDEKKDNKEKSKKTAEKTLKLMDKVGSSLLGTKTVGEKPSVFKTKSLAMMLDRQVPSKIGGKKLGEGEGESGVALPSAATLFGDSAESLPSVDSQMLSFTDNPYTWDASSSNIKSSVIDFSLKAADGSALEVSGLPEPVELFIPQKEGNENNGNETATVYFVKPSDGYNNLRFHQVVVPSASSSMMVEVKPEDGVSLEIFVKPKIKPTVTEYSFGVILPKIELCNLTKATLNCSSEAYRFSISSALTNYVGLHYIGIRYPRPENDPTSSSKVVAEIVAERVRRGCESHGGRKKRSCVGIKTPPTTPPPAKLQILVPKYNASTDVNYTMSVAATSCLYWSETKQTWTDHGCKVGPKTVARNLHCLCTHLSAFGGDFFVAPNPIDFDKVWAEFGNLAESGNFVVLATVCSIFGLYFVGLVFARKADKKDEKKVVANVYLTDNTEDGYLYEISVQTGMWNGYGTTANIGLIIYGEHDTTPPLPLVDPEMNKIFFARGSINNFTLSVPESLGNLVKIKIWHDNSGRSPAWFFQQVQIVDAQTGDKWNFLGNCWLAVEKGSGQIELEVKVADKKELAGFRNLFYSRTARSLGDGHLWLSVFTRPPHNKFTRCQRLTCCLSILFATLVTNAMFYQFDKAPGDTFQVGPLKLSWIQIKIGIQSSIIAIPVNVLVVTIFKNIKHPLPVDARGSNKKVLGCLPHFFVYVGWTLCLLTSLAAGAFTVFYSLMWGAETSNKWLTSIMISFFQDVVVTQPIKVVLIASLLSLIIKKPPEQEEVIGSSMSRSSGKDSQVAAPRGEVLRKARELQTKVLEMFRTIVEMVFFFLFIAFLMVVCYGNRKPTRFMLTTELERRFSGFDEVHGTDTFWTWTRTILVPGLYDVAWYNGNPFEYKEGFISSREAFMVGMPRLRQARIKPDERCAMELNQPELAHQFGRCLSVYVDKVADSTLFNQPGWFPVRNTSEALSKFELYDMCPRPWRYRTAENLTTLSAQGLQSSYGGGGFVADLGYNTKSALTVLDGLQKNNWINDLTAAVFVEFTIHEPATALFSVVKYMFERLPTGGYNTVRTIKTLTLYASPDSAFGSFYQFCQLLLMLIILFFFFAEIGKIYRQKCGYFKLFWNWMELLQIFGAVAAIVMFFFKEMYTSRYVKRVQNNPFETSSTDYIVLWSELEIYLLAFVIFIVTMKFLRLIRFNRHICQMIATIHRSVGHLFSFFVVFVAIILAYTQLGLLVFGATVPAYSSFFQAMRAVCQMILGGESHFHELKATSRFVGPLFVFCYMLSMSMIMLNMFLAILNDSYEEVKDVEGDSFDDAELGEFMKTYFVTRVGYFCDDLTAYFKRMMSFAQARTRPKIQDVESYVKIPTDSVDGLDKVDDIDMGDDSVKLAKIVSMEDLSDSEDDISEGLEDVKRSLSDISEELRRSISLLGSDSNLKTLNKDLKCSCEENSFQYFGNIWERQYDPNDRIRRRGTPYTEPLLAEIPMDHLKNPHLSGEGESNDNDRNGYPYFTNIWDRLIDPNDRFRRRRRLRTPHRQSRLDDNLQDQTEEVDLGDGEDGDSFERGRLEEHSTPEVMSNSTTNSNLLDDVQESFV